MSAALAGKITGIVVGLLVGLIVGSAVIGNREKVDWEIVFVWLGIMTALIAFWGFLAWLTWGTA